MILEHLWLCGVKGETIEAGQHGDGSSGRPEVFEGDEDHDDAKVELSREVWS